MVILAGFFLFRCVSVAAALIDLNVGSDTNLKLAQENGNPATIANKEDLDAYAQAAMQSDSAIAGMNFSTDAVEVRYKESAKFLALIPVTFTVVARADADGSVSVSYPWYSFLTVDNHDRIETELKIAVDNALRSRLVGSVQAAGKAETPTFTAAESADIAGEMSRVLKTNVDGFVSENVE